MKSIRTEIYIGENGIKEGLRNDIWESVWVCEGIKIKYGIGEKIWNNINTNISQRIYDTMMEKFMHRTLMPEHKFLF